MKSTVMTTRAPTISMITIPIDTAVYVVLFLFSCWLSVNVVEVPEAWNQHNNEFWPTWVFTGDTNCICLYRSCYVYTLTLEIRHMHGHLSGSGHGCLHACLEDYGSRKQCIGVINETFRGFQSYKNCFLSQKGSAIIIIIIAHTNSSCYSLQHIIASYIMHASKS